MFNKQFQVTYSSPTNSTEKRALRIRFRFPSCRLETETTASVQTWLLMW